MRRATILPALAMILVGTYLLLGELNLEMPGLDEIWPVLPFSGGIACLGSYLLGRRQDHGLVFWGTVLTLGGLSLFLVTLTDRDYTLLRTWWPVFVVIAGISFLALWLAQGLRDWGVLFLAFVGLLFGGMALLASFRPRVARELTPLWPALLILVGLILLLRAVLSGGKTKQ
jgi:hypothetical protein